MEKRYLAMWMWLCEGKSKVKTAHFRLPSASQKRSCLSSLIISYYNAKPAAFSVWRAFSWQKAWTVGLTLKLKLRFKFLRSNEGIAFLSKIYFPLIVQETCLNEKNPPQEQSREETRKEPSYNHSYYIRASKLPFITKLTCSYSSVIAFGSSCLWNHIMYLVWNLQDCFFKAFAAKYCALVPWNI